MNTRYRMVMEQGGNTHVSSIVLTEEEAVQSLQAEAIMHTLADWDVAVMFADTIAFNTVHERLWPVVVCERAGVTRTLSVLAASPLEDTLEI